MEITPSMSAQTNTRIDSEKIRAQAKKIMDEFMSALDKAENNNSSFGEERQSSTREKTTSHAGNQDFRKAMFHNAPKKNDDYIIAEKKKW